MRNKILGFGVGLSTYALLNRIGVNPLIVAGSGMWICIIVVVFWGQEHKP